MKLFKVLEDVVQYLSEAFVVIFGPAEEPVPIIGVQPFTGEPLAQPIED